MDDTQKTYKPIETHYQGWKFRSRLEARWAVFFDTLGIEYRYEHEGFNLDGVTYLPDFYLPHQQIWVEIKPSLPSREEREKVIRLCLATKQPVALLCGDTWVDNSAFGFLFHDPETMDQLIKHYEKNANLVTWITTSECFIARQTGQKSGVDLERGFTWSQICWIECLLCGNVNINALGMNYCSCKEKKASDTTPRLMAAYTAARSARFGKEGRS